MKMLLAAPLLTLALLGQQAVAQTSEIESNTPEQTETGYEVENYGFEELTSLDEVEVSDDAAAIIDQTGMSLTAGSWARISCQGAYRGLNYCRMPAHLQITQAHIQTQGTTCSTGWGWDSRSVWVRDNCKVVVAVYLAPYVRIPVPHRDHWRPGRDHFGRDCWGRSWGRDRFGRLCIRVGSRYDDDDDRRRRVRKQRASRRNDDDNDRKRRRTKRNKRN